jgi:hypothetical protein
MRIKKELIEKIESITMVDYEVMNNETGCLIPVENIEAVLEDLLLEIDAREEKYEDFKNEVKEFYELKRFDPYKEYGISEKDFH